MFNDLYTMAMMTKQAASDPYAHLMGPSKPAPVDPMAGMRGNYVPRQNSTLDDLADAQAAGRAADAASGKTRQARQAEANRTIVDHMQTMHDIDNPRTVADLYAEPAAVAPAAKPSMLAKLKGRYNGLGRGGKAGLIGGALGLGAAGAGTTYAMNHKTASVNEVPASFYEIGMAKQAAAELYEDCLDKLAYAEQLFDEADFVEKVAADNGAGAKATYVNEYETPVGATVTGQPIMQGQALQGISNPAGQGIGQITNAGALNSFIDQFRLARAQQEQAKVQAKTAGLYGYGAR